MTAHILKDIITNLGNIGFTVVAVVSDMGSTNQGLWKELKIDMESVYFDNPTDTSKKVFVFADVPHLIKLVRNHFLDSGFIWNEKKIDKEPIKEILRKTASSDLRITFNISNEHLDVKMAGRQKVSTATQLLSHTTAEVIK